MGRDEKGREWMRRDKKDGMGRDEKGWEGMRRDETGWDGMGWDGTGRDGMGRDGTGRAYLICVMDVSFSLSKGRWNPNVNQRSSVYRNKSRPKFV